MSSLWISGTPVAPGLAVGPVHVVRATPGDVPEWTVPKDDLPAEIGRLASAMNAAAEELTESQRIVAASASDQDAEIFAVHRMILRDPGALKEVEETIAEERINAEAAVQRLIRRFETTMGKLEGERVRGFASDVSDPWRRVLDALLIEDREAVEMSDQKVVLAAKELTPKVVTFLVRGRVLAIVCETGGRFSHGAVLARALGVPCVVGLPNLLARLEQGMTLAVNGDRGRVQLAPGATELAEFLERRASRAQRAAVLEAEANLPAVTPDGTRLQVRVNLESLHDFDTFDVEHSDGVGLFRTEFLYLERNEFPSEEEQYRLYRLALDRLGGRTATFRLLDVGGDKPLPYFKTPSEANPALGWRGLRITLKWRDLMRIQLRALLRASPLGNLRVLLPMVTSIEEIEEVHQIFDSVRDELRSQGYEVAADVPVGSMIEVPSALFVLDRLTKVVNFVSVGTNDLVQYLLAADRDNALVADLYDPRHPAVIRALGNVARAAREEGLACSVCGEIAGDPAMALLLLGLGFDEVSVAPHFVPEIKYAARRMNRSDAQGFASEALQQTTSEGVRLILERMRELLYGSTDDDED
jgi:phosphotransferase system enzyme I (PtsI)